MAAVVFLRGVNVGGHKKFQPSALARELANLGVVNVGAAGTFVVRGAIGRESLRKEILRRLPFESELMICPAREILGMVQSQPFGPEAPRKDVQWFVSVMGKPPRSLPPLPMDQPIGDKWEVRVIRVTGRYAFSLKRRQGRGVYPNEVVEKKLGVSATTRGWNTITAICGILESA